MEERVAGVERERGEVTEVEKAHYRTGFESGQY